MACEDTRQLTEAQRQAAYQQQRTGVQRAVRPFTGRATLDNLIDYINRELQPAVRATRDAVNEVYLPVVDNAPSANPLAYYFSTETGAADPTAGRIRLNQATQDTSTVIRISEDNARLQDVLPWLEVMAGGVTAPLGVITLYDAVNPARFLRFDLESMTDQGDYWDLGVTVVESSHDNPFVDGGAVTLSYIPGVADNEGTGAVIPPGSIEPIATDTFLGNISGSTAAPSAVPLANVDSTSIVYNGTAHEFRRAALTGFAAATENSNATTSAEPIITYTASSNMSAERVLSDGHMTTVDLGTAGQAQVDLANMTAGTAIGRQIDAGTGAPVALTGAEQGENVQFTTIVVDATTTGTVAAYSFAEPNNALVFQNVTVIVQGIVARPSGTLIWLRHTGTGSTTLVHQSGSAASADTISTGGADILLTNTMQALLLYTNGRWRVYGVSHGVRPALSGAISAAANVYATLFSGILDNGAAENDRTNLNFVSSTSNTAVVTDDAANDELEVTYQRAALTGFAEAAANSNATTSAEPLITYSASSNMSAERVATSSTSITVSTGVAGQIEWQRAALTGDVTASANANSTTIANDAVTDAKLRNSAALSVIGRSANSSGDPADIAAANDGEVLRRSGTTLGFGTIATAGLADASVTLAKMANLAAGTVIGRQIDAVTGVPVALTGAEQGENVQFATIVTDSTSSGTFTAFDFPAPNNALVFVNTSVTLQGVLARPTGTVMLLRHSGTGATTLSNENASASANDRLDFGPSGTPDLVLSSGMQALFVWAQGRWRCYGFSPCVLNEDKGDVTVSGSRGQTWTIDNAAVSLAKMANLAQSTIIGRAEGAGTGVPQALTPTQVVSIIDGESPTWTGSHTFDGEVQLTDRLRLNSVISPTALTADQNNYNPTNWATANIVRLSTDGTSATVRDITGAAAGTGGEIKYLINLGPGDIRLQHDHASSSAANRFRFASLTTFTLDPEDMAGIWYDETSFCWRVLQANPTS